MNNILPHDFNHNLYKKYNPDLKISTKSELELHYINNYIKDNRIYKIILPDDFIVSYYRQINNDLKNISDNDLAIHYMKHGKTEKRIYKDNIDEYLKLYNYLKSLTIHEAAQYFLISDIKDVRLFNIILPDDFNINDYKIINNDLSFNSDDKYEVHYYFFGQHRDYNLNNKVCYLNKITNKFIWINEYTNNNQNISEKIKKYEKSNIYKINENNVLLDYNVNYTKLYYIKNKELEELNNINNLKSFILIIDFPNGGGGTTKFLNLIISHYKYKNTFLIARNYNNLIHFTINDEYELEYKYNEEESILFLQENSNKITKIFINHILNHTDNFINTLFLLNKHISVITHDYYLINELSQPYYHQISNMLENSIISKCDTIITQNIVNIENFNKFINDKTELIVTPLPDFNKTKNICFTNNSNIVIGIIGSIIDIKGKYIVEELINYYKSNNNVKIVIFGIIELNYKNQFVYNNIDELNNLLERNKPNILIETSLWPETYSYTLTLSMLTDLPIIYLKKPFSSVIMNRLSNYEKAHSFESISEFDNLIYKYKQNYFYTIEPVIYFNSFWDSYFNPDISKLEYKSESINSNKYNIKSYCVYFPQFHNFTENDIAFYKNFTDIHNLFLISKNINNYNALNIESPNLQEYNLNNMIDYNLTDYNIIQKQIDIITLYNISGFAIYYYWFSINTVTDNHMIMEKVINLFFDSKINMNDRKVFFIWANESWTQNPAFGNSSEKIENIYDENYINLNVNNLVNYFKHDNYLKIDNKPVFMLHHPWFMTDSEIKLLYNTLNYKCIKNLFKGVYFIINSINGYYDGYINYNFNFNYKKSKSCYYDENLSQIYLDYKKYINNDLDNINNNSIINTVVFDFDNRIRLSKPYRLQNSTICVNNSEFNKILFLNKIIETYNKNTKTTKKSDIENIMLINGWNEWGEKMNIEPSSQYNFYYLNLLKKYLQD